MPARQFPWVPILLLCLAMVVGLGIWLYSMHTLSRPVAALNTHLGNDLGIRLPTAIKVKNSNWVSSRDPEEMYCLEMSPADAEYFVRSVVAAGANRYWVTAENGSVEVNPHQGIPDWWNNPPLADARRVIVRSNRSEFGYAILWSPSSGILYIDWGVN